ncbi:hypothetical protein POM88_049632 [Heracleum sosnowskyi]|uniref:Uncharacterized protein n=1 Tax=Heracleum sosnowskyi TaxID=360622 RepID=A0AAD8GX72_9APIA|nr:hypothetical protein POM88_049632 [Heracleum sosnowskyi]
MVTCHVWIFTPSRFINHAMLPLSVASTTTSSLILNNCKVTGKGLTFLHMKVAICAAKGLTFLHEDGPLQAMFHEFSTGNIQIDKDYSAKLSGYGCVSHIPETYIFNYSVVTSLLLATSYPGVPMSYPAYGGYGNGNETWLENHSRYYNWNPWRCFGECWWHILHPRLL